jgi:hypothetical protein
MHCHQRTATAVVATVKPAVAAATAATAATELIVTMPALKRHVSEEAKRLFVSGLVSEQEHTASAAPAPAPAPAPESASAPPTYMTESESLSLQRTLAKVSLTIPPMPVARQHHWEKYKLCKQVPVFVTDGTMARRHQCCNVQ